jgi:hypothetical protein
MILLEENVSTLLHAVLILIKVHDFQRVVVSSLVFDFHIPVDFGLNVLFPHIFSVLHRNSVETCWFSLVMYESPLTEEISMQSSLDGRISMFLPPVLAQSAFALPKKKSKSFGPD